MKKVRAQTVLIPKGRALQTEGTASSKAGKWGVSVMFTEYQGDQWGWMPEKMGKEMTCCLRNNK